MKHRIKLHHISYAVRDTDKSIVSFRHIYPEVVMYKKKEPSQKVKITYLKAKDSKEMVELVEPYGKEGPVTSMLLTKTSLLYHTCYEVDDFDYFRSVFKKKGYFLITSPFLSNYEKNNWVCHFYDSRSGVIEIMGKKI